MHRHTIPPMRGGLHARHAISRLRPAVCALTPGLVAFMTTCLALLPVEYRMPIETALIALFPQHAR